MNIQTHAHRCTNINTHLVKTIGNLISLKINSNYNDEFVYFSCCYQLQTISWSQNVVVFVNIIAASVALVVVVAIAATTIAGIIVVVVVTKQIAIIN